MALAVKSTVKVGWWLEWTYRSHSCIFAGQGGKEGAEKTGCTSSAVLVTGLSKLCKCLLVSKALRHTHIFSTLLTVLEKWILVNGGKQLSDILDSVEEPKLLDLSELLIFPLKLGKGSKVSGNILFHGVKSDSYALFKTTMKILWVRRTTPLVKLEKAHLFSEWQEINILCTYYYVYFCQCWEMDKHFSSGNK